MTNVIDFDTLLLRINSSVPMNTTKKEFYEVMHRQAGWSLREVKRKTIERIVELRKVPSKEARTTRVIYPNELIQIIDDFKIGT
ncbi:hypothetical protein [Flavobacterium sp. SOK18b]|uniref:hypothetical protein n=1 Tax=Flavobacterium sp. SOK18b TaxID=797900 RepID=UPI0015FBAE7D|nr:hypothetical protein [Flavobacterium sp. SOK18b]